MCNSSPLLSLSLAPRKAMSIWYVTREKSTDSSLTLEIEKKQEEREGGVRTIDCWLRTPWWWGRRAFASSFSSFVQRRSTSAQSSDKQRSARIADGQPRRRRRPAPAALRDDNEEERKGVIFFHSSFSSLFSKITEEKDDDAAPSSSPFSNNTRGERVRSACVRSFVYVGISQYRRVSRFGGKSFPICFVLSKRG